MTLTAVINTPADSLTAIISTPADSVTASLDPLVLQQARTDLYETAKKHGFIGTFEQFLSHIAKAENLISSDTPNSITLGSDNKLLVSPSFNNQTYLTQSDW